MASYFSNKSVLITGAASGIGKAVATRVAKQGGKLVLWDINQENLEATIKELAPIAHHPPKGYKCDLRKRSQIYSVAKRVQKQIGDIDILINNAGIVSGKSLLDISDDAISATFDVNTLALFWTTRAFLPAMIQRNTGHIVTMASSAGFIGAARLTDYCSSKWAAVGFDESLRMELRHTAPGINTTVVCPFLIDTGMFQGAQTRFPFLLPILKESNVADQIIDSIAKKRQKLIVPPFVNLVPIFRILPTAVFDKVADFLGINAAMDKFTGRH
ncbi:MAG: SDR family oxidoreductase [Myxococcota bacterium]|nr:SDR family oxidoreductase [Myxococcota bacterium]